MTEPAAFSRPWRLLAPELVDVLRSRLDSTVDSVARSVSEVPAFADIDDPKFERDLHRAVRSAVEHFLELAGTDEPALPPRVRATFVGLGAAEARDERSPDVLLAALRTSSRSLLRIASDALGTARPVESAELLDLADAVTAYVDELVAATTDGYARQVREQAGETDRRRRLLGELLLRGSAAEAAVRAAASDIGWKSLTDVVPVLLATEDARDARFRYGADGVVVDRDHDAVLLVRAGRRADRSRLADELAGRSAVVAPALPSTRVPEGVRLAELTATLVARDKPLDPVFVEDHLAALALRGETGALAVLSARRLGAFAHVPHGTRERLLETLRSWLMHWGSRADVAAELFIHPQTVSYRVRRLREVLGDELDDPAVRFELLLVLADRVRR